MSSFQPASGGAPPPQAPMTSAFSPAPVNGSIYPTRLPPVNIRGQIGRPPQVVQQGAAAAVENREGSLQPGAPANDAVAEQLKALLFQALIQQQQQPGTATGTSLNEQQRQQTVAALTALLQMYGPRNTDGPGAGQEAKSVSGKPNEPQQEKEASNAAIRAKGKSETASALLKEYRENFRQMEEAYQALQVERSSLKKRHDELLNEHEKLNISLQKVLNEIAELKAKEQAEADANVMVVQFIVNALRLFLDAALSKQKVEDVLPSLRHELEKLRLPAHDPRLLNCYNRLRQLAGQEPVMKFGSRGSDTAGGPVSQKSRGNIAEGSSDSKNDGTVPVSNGTFPARISLSIEAIRRDDPGGIDGEKANAVQQGMTLGAAGVSGGRARRQSELPGSTAADKRLEEDSQLQRRAGSDGLLDVPGTGHEFQGVPALGDNARRHSATAVGDGSISLAAQFAIAAMAPAPREEHTPVLLPEKTILQKASENEEAASGVSTTFLAAQTAAAPDGSGMLQGGVSTSFQRELQQQLQLLLQQTQVVPYRSRTDSADMLNGKRPDNLSSSLGLDRHALSCSSDWTGSDAASVAAELLRRASSVSMSTSDVRRLLEAVVPAERQHHPTLHLSSSASMCVPPTPQRTRIGVESPDKTSMQGRWSLDETAGHRSALIRDVCRSGSYQMEEGVMAPQPSRAGPRGAEDTGFGAYSTEGGVDLMAVYRAVLDIERKQRDEDAGAQARANGDVGEKKGTSVGTACGGAINPGGSRVGGTGTGVGGPQPLTPDQLQQIATVLQQQLASVRPAGAQNQDQWGQENLVETILTSLAGNTAGSPPPGSLPGGAGGSPGGQASPARGTAVQNSTLPGSGFPEGANKGQVRPGGVNAPTSSKGGDAASNSRMSGAGVPLYGSSSGGGGGAGPFPLITVPAGTQPFLCSAPPPAPWVFGPGTVPPHGSTPLAGSFPPLGQANSPSATRDHQASANDHRDFEGASVVEGDRGRSPVSPPNETSHTTDGGAGTATGERAVGSPTKERPSSWCCGPVPNRPPQ
ncbi:hypothetical protein CSUI_002975 [Cystoisospora suis]|uniref:Uncharacterized protein n=1 Tax=Cystoisospora suis TaxID=483139 RepID=A0A2C6L2N8_9APIC|nr:hypothetical protein CSUI_002975 [Cystoisospora suis]